MSRVSAITLTRASADGRYADVLDAAEALESKYGSATNAIAVMCRESPSYREALAARDAAKKPARGRGATASD